MGWTSHDDFATPSVRFAFDDAVISWDVAADATLEDIARLWREMEGSGHGPPIDVKITFATSRDALKAPVPRLTGEPK